MVGSKETHDKLAAFLEDLESLSWVQGDEDHTEQVVRVSDARALLAQMACEADERGITGVWPHTPSRRAPANVRLHMPMDLPVFGELRRPKVQRDPSDPKYYILELDLIAWGRIVVMKMLEGEFSLFVKDAKATRKVYTGSRRDDGDLTAGMNGR